MTIGTPLWDEFVANLKEVKVTVEDMGFMPDNFPCELGQKSMTSTNKAILRNNSYMIIHNCIYKFIIFPKGNCNL